MNIKEGREGEQSEKKSLKKCAAAVDSEFVWRAECNAGLQEGEEKKERHAAFISLSHVHVH